MKAMLDPRIVAARTHGSAARSWATKPGLDRSNASSHGGLKMFAICRRQTTKPVRVRDGSARAGHSATLAEEARPCPGATMGLLILQAGVAAQLNWRPGAGARPPRGWQSAPPAVRRRRMHRAGSALRRAQPTRGGLQLP